MCGTDYYCEGSRGPIYLTTYKGQMINLKLTISNGSSSSRCREFTSVASGIQLCLDNLSVARAAGKTTGGSSQKPFKQFRDAAKIWMDSRKKMTVNWIPGHSGIEGNEIADKEAKKYTNESSQGHQK